MLKPISEPFESQNWVTLQIYSRPILGFCGCFFQGAWGKNYISIFNILMLVQDSKDHIEIK